MLGTQVRPTVLQVLAPPVLFTPYKPPASIPPTHSNPSSDLGPKCKGKDAGVRSHIWAQLLHISSSTTQRLGPQHREASVSSFIKAVCTLSTYCMPSKSGEIHQGADVDLCLRAAQSLGNERPTSNEQIQQSCKTLHRPPCFRLPISGQSPARPPPQVRSLRPVDEAHGFPLAYLTPSLFTWLQGQNVEPGRSLVPRPSFPRVTTQQESATLG